MPSATDSVDRPSDAVAVAQRYQRIERPCSVAVGVLAAAVAAVALFFLPFVRGLLVALAVVALVRVPVFRASGTARLTTSGDPAAVRADFESATPPPLALQWGIADSVRSTADGAVYDISYLFGLRSVEMTVEVRPAATGCDADVVVTAGGRPWATYSVSVYSEDGETVVDVDWVSDRRFGLRRLPQWVVAERYRAGALATQGYAVSRRDASLSL